MTHLKKITVCFIFFAFLNANTIYTDGDMNEDIQNLNVSNYYSDGRGAVYIYGNLLGNISNSNFTDNGVDNYGGAITVTNRLYGTISNSNFIGNSAFGDMFGGGAIISTAFFGNITNSIFSNNNAYNGGAIYLEDSYGIIEDTNFIGNRASGKGGAIYIYGAANMTLRSTNHMLFEGNRDSNGSNAIYYDGYGGYDDGIINIITDSGSIMEFKDTISDYGKDESGILYVKKNGEGILIYDAAMTYRGDTNIYEGILVIRNAGSVANTLNIADNAILSVDKTYQHYALGPNVNIHSGTLDINLNNKLYWFSFANETMQQNFVGTLNLTNTSYGLLKDNGYELVLNNNSVSTLDQDNATLKSLVLNGGALNLSYIINNTNGEPILNINNFTIKDNSAINFYTDLRNNESNLTNNQNLYDALNGTYKPLYQIINATEGVQGNKSNVNISNTSPHNYAISNIIQNNAKAGEIFMNIIGSLEDDGVYIGLGNATKIKSLTNVMLDSDNALNNRLDTVLTGNGNFTFGGNNFVFIGNNASDYTGATFLVNYANITAQSDNAFGQTNYLFLENGTVINLNSYSQVINGKLENNGSVDLTNGGELSFKGGYSLGNNSLIGNGTLTINGNFLVEGSNKNLRSNIILNNGTATIKQIDSFGNITNLTFNKGGLNLEAFDILAPFEPILKVDSINIGGDGGAITINSNLTQLAGNVTANLSLYDYSELSNAYKIINASSGVNGAKTQLSITNAIEQTSMDITQNNTIVGEAIFSNIASVQDDGIYIGFGLKEITSYLNVEFNAFDTTNNILNAILSGNGNMTFAGGSVYIGNAASNYTGSTLLKDGASIMAISNNIFGNTTYLALEKDTIFNLNSYSQAILGKLDNNGTIDLGNYAAFEFSGGNSFGNNSLRGYGEIFINGDFNVEGENNDLHSYISINNGTTTLSSANSLGKYGYISLESNTNLIINTDNNEVLTNSIYGYYNNVSLIKKGGGSLKLDEYVYVELVDVANGSLVVDAYKFYGDVNIASDSVLVFDNTWDSNFFNQFYGNGSITQLGNYALTLYENSFDFTGSYNIENGILKTYSFDALANAKNITISHDAIYEVESNRNENLTNNIIGTGALHVNLNDVNNNLTIANTEVLQDFNGIIELTNVKYNLSGENNYSLLLNRDSLTVVDKNDSSLKDLIFEGGTLNLNIDNVSSPLQIMLNVENLNIGGNGGKIAIEANLDSLVSDVDQNSNLYDYSLPTNAQKIVNAQEGVKGVGTQITIDGTSDKNFINITQDGDVVGKAAFGTIATVENDGIYLGFGLEAIESDKIVELNSSSAVNFLLNAKLAGNGGFIFSGNNSVFVGNAMSDYTGNTLLKENANLTAISHNSFGYTDSLSLEEGAVFNLGTYYQYVKNGLNNNATININGGELIIDGSMINNGIINLNDYSYMYLMKGGISIGDNALKGGGFIEFYDDFEIRGINKNLTADIYLSNALLKLNSASGLGDNGAIYLGSDNSIIHADIGNNETMNKNIYGQGMFIKDGNGSLKINSTAVNTASILEGTLIIDANNFYGDINISQNANLIFDNSQNTAFYNKLSGNGNIIQVGNSVFSINSDNSEFNGVYTINNGALVIGSSSDYMDALLGGDITANNALVYTFGSIKDKMALNNSSWYLGKDSAIKTLVLSDTSNVFMNSAEDFISLEIDNLKGDSGNFYQRVQLHQLGNSVVNRGDLLIIGNSSEGNHRIYFNDSDSGALSIPYEENILIVKQDNSNGDYKADFIGTVDIGATQYSLVKSDTNNNFYLKSGGCTSYACASLSFPNINYMLNHITTDTLFQRMGELDANRTNRDDVWIRTYFGELNSFANHFSIDKINYYGLALGMDRMYETDMSNIFLGFTIGLNEADTTYKNGSADSSHYSAGIYGALKNYDGFYIDMLVKYQRNKNSFDTKTSNGFNINGNGNSDGIIISIEGGKRYDIGRYFIEPQIQYSYFYHDKFAINSSNGLKMQIDNFESARTRVGALFGYKLQQADIYLKAGYIKELKGSYNYSFNDGEEQEYAINWDFFDSALGFALNSNNNHFYFEGVYQTGSAFKNMKLNAGYRYEF